MQEPATVPVAPIAPQMVLKPVETAEEADKGLKSNAVGLLSSIVIGVASTAPAYSLAVTLGLVTAVAGIGLKSPAIMIVSFIPMIFIASSYYYLNKVDPDCGTTFSWVTRAMGPRTGWVTGWVMVAADIIVMASLAQITGAYFFLLFGANGLAASTFWVTFAGVLFLILMCVITAIGIEISARLQWFLLGFEYLMLIVFSVVALTKVYASHPAGAVHPAFSWFVPNMRLGALASGVLLALFIYWGWDTAVSVNEETQDKSRTPGIAAVLSTLALVFIYVLATTSAQAFHGPGYLTKNSADVLSPLGSGVLGSGFDKLLIAVVLTSATASTLTTILPGARTTLSMAAHRAIPGVWAKVNPRFQTPVWGTAIYGVLSLVWYVGLTLISRTCWPIRSPPSGLRSPSTTASTASPFPSSIVITSSRAGRSSCCSVPCHCSAGSPWRRSSSARSTSSGTRRTRPPARRGSASARPSSSAGFHPGGRRRDVPDGEVLEARQAVLQPQA